MISLSFDRLSSICKSQWILQFKSTIIFTRVTLISILGCVWLCNYAHVFYLTLPLYFLYWHTHTHRKSRTHSHWTFAHTLKTQSKYPYKCTITIVGLIKYSTLKAKSHSDRCSCGRQETSKNKTLLSWPTQLNTDSKKFHC